ncbi:MAG: VWA domain-containing protein [Prevotella sp.]|nr:VWA domain-containing protein [Prevotella sp.]
MSYNSILDNTDLVDNPTPRVPICLCLDTSGSMDAVEGDCQATGETVFRDGRTWNVVTGGTTRLNELQEGIKAFYDAIHDDEIAMYSAEICIVTFDDKATCVMDFGTVENQTDIPKLTTGDKTCMGEGVNLALDLLDQRKERYKDSGVDYFQPWLVIMTDGAPNGSAGELARASQRIAELVNAKKLTVFPIGIGNEADKSALESLSPKRSPLKLQGLKFREFFAWLSQSVSRTSQSMPGEKIPLDSEGVKEWGSLGWDTL